MRNLLPALVLVAGLGATLAPATAAPLTNHPSLEGIGNLVEHAQWGRSRCDRLRRACQFKDERGERGEGNCRRYREQCGRWWR